MTAPARAQLFVATPNVQPPAVEHAELSYALGEGPPVTWLSVRAERGPLAIVAALPDGARATAGLDAWLGALEASASINVLPPSAAERCLEGAPFARVTWPRDRGTAPAELVLESKDDVAAALSELDLPAPASLPDAPSFVVWAFPAEEGALTTRTLRVEGAALPLGAGWHFPVLVSLLTRGSQRYPGEAAASELEVTFTPGKRAESDYAERLRAWLERGEPPILELRAKGPLFDWSIYEDTLSTAPLVQAYAERAESELGGVDAKACGRQLAAFRERVAPDTSACGDAQDATLALTATGAENATLQRFAIASAAGVDPSALLGGGALASPLLRAATLTGGDCPAVPLPPIARDPPASAPVTEPPPVNEEIVVVERDYYDDSDVEVSCWGEPGTSDPYYEDDYGSDDADCSSDTSTTSDGSDDVDCSSDTSTTSDGSDDADCSSDTSTTSDDSDSGCGSDTSTTSDGDTGYDGETCTGSAAPKAEPAGQRRESLSAPTQRKRGKRLKLSLWSVGFAAFMLPIRRRKRSAARPS